MQNSHNYILHPMYPEFNKLVKVIKVERLEIDARLI
jgi:hypothetical protein